MTESTHLNASSVVENTEQTPQNQDPYAEVTLSENSLISPAMLEAFKQHAAQIKLPAQSVQQWIRLEETRLQQIAQEEHENRQEQQRAWAQQTQAQWGNTWQEEVSGAVRAADAFGGPELRQLLEETGLGNHPAIIRTFAEVAKRMSEDKSVRGVASASTDKTFTQALYGKE